MLGGLGPKAVLARLKGKSMLDTAENWSVLFLVVGAVALSVGIGLTVVSPQGVPAIVSMAGALLSFLSTAALIVIWVVKEIFTRE